MLFCGEFLWITSMTGIKQLIGGFAFFGWFLIDILKCINFCD